MADCEVHYAKTTRSAWAKWRKKMHQQNKVHRLETCKRGKICTAHAWCLQGAGRGAWDYDPRRASLHGGCHGAETLQRPRLKPGLLSLEFHSPLQFFRRWQHLSTSLNLEVHKIPLLASSYCQCADLALGWDRTSGKASLAHVLGIHVAASSFAPPLLCHYWRQCYFC